MKATRKVLVGIMTVYRESSFVEHLSADVQLISPGKELARALKKIPKWYYEDSYLHWARCPECFEKAIDYDGYNNSALIEFSVNSENKNPRVLKVLKHYKKNSQKE